MKPISLQLYTLREAIENDLQVTLDRVRKIGFEFVELYDFPEQVDFLEQGLAATGLRAPTGHAKIIDSLEANRIFDAAERLGIKLVIDPFIPTERWRTSDDVMRLAERVNALSAQAAERGLSFGYHNHQWEFTNRIEGQVVFELFVDQLAPAVALEVDAFWAAVGGADVPRMLMDLGNRVAAIHVKDGKTAGDIATALPSSEDALIVPHALKEAFQNQKPAGQGDLDMPAILSAAPKALRVVEFDAFRGDIFGALEVSLHWLQENDR